MGDRVRAARARNGVTRKALAKAAGVSERHLANLESGHGNVSVVVLHQVATALHCSFAELVGDFTTTSPEWLMLRSLLENCDPQTLHTARLAVAEIVDSAGQAQHARQLIALVGLRGAGKTTLGQKLAERLGLRFIEISREVENLAGCSIAEIQGLYGSSAYRRYERKALQQAVESEMSAVIATPGGLVSDPINFDLLLRHCHSVWLQATPADHMRRVIEQGDFRPMAGNSEAMQDLKGILAAREPFYARARYRLDTSQQSFDATLQRLLELSRNALSPSTSTVTHRVI